MSRPRIGQEAARFFASEFRAWLPAGTTRKTSLIAGAIAACAALTGAYELGKAHGELEKISRSAQAYRGSSAEAQALREKFEVPEVAVQAMDVAAARLKARNDGAALETQPKAFDPAADIVAMSRDVTRGFPLAESDIAAELDLLDNEAEEAFEDSEEFQVPPEDVAAVILSASEAVGTDPALMLAIAHRESSFRPNVASNRSSAVGLYQFTNVTWMRAVMEFGANHGLDDHAKHIYRLEDGKMGVRGRAERAQLLELRKDPGYASLMAAELVRDNGERLERLVGRPAEVPDIYLAHLLGVQTAAKFLTALKDNPDQRASLLAPRAAAANPDVFAPGGRHRSVGELYASVVDSIEARRNAFRSVVADAGASLASR